MIFINVIIVDDVDDDDDDDDDDNVHCFYTPILYLSSINDIDC